jgi:hypothetical protein
VTVELNVKTGSPENKDACEQSRGRRRLQGRSESYDEFESCFELNLKLEILRAINCGKVFGI